MFKGTLTAIITPFVGESGIQPAIDWDGFEKLVAWQFESGVSGVVVGATSGESPTLTFDEKIELNKRALKIAKGKGHIIGGAGSSSTKETLDLTKALQELGVDGVLISSPPYNKPTQEGLYQHFATIAKECDLPILIYDIPGRTAVEISTDTLCRLAEIKNIVGLKLAVDSATKILEVCRRVPKDFSILSGEDNLVYSMMALGGKGVISATANVIPEKFVKITNAIEQGDYATACKTQMEITPIIQSMFVETSPGPAKAALKMLGKIESGALRLPMVEVKESTKEIIANALGVKN